MIQLPNAIQDLLVNKVAIERLAVYLNQPEVERTNRCASDRRIIFDNATIGWPQAENIEVSEASPAFTLNDIDLCLPEGKLTLVCGPLGSGKTLLVSNIATASVHLSAPCFIRRSSHPVRGHCRSTVFAQYDTPQRKQRVSGVDY